jgi:hypothetical protein
VIREFFGSANSAICLTFGRSGMVRQHQTRNLEILRCATAHHSSMLRIAPE